MKFLKVYQKEIAALVGAVITFFATGGEVHLTKTEIVVKMPFAQSVATVAHQR